MSRLRSHVHRRSNGRPPQGTAARGTAARAGVVRVLPALVLVSALVVACFLGTMVAPWGHAPSVARASASRDALPARTHDPLADVSPPLTSISTSPMTPNGDSGWFKGAAPLVTPTAMDPEGSEPAMILYDWGADPPGSVHGSTHTAPIGETVLFYRSIDSVGNEEPVRRLTFKVDTGVPAPVVSMPVGDEGAPLAAGGTLRFEATVSDGVSGVSFVAFYYFVRDDGGWASVGIQIGPEQAPPSGHETDTGIVYGVPWNTFLVPDGEYKLQVQVRDIAGNTAFSAPQFVDVDNWDEAGASGPTGSPSQ